MDKNLDTPIGQTDLDSETILGSQRYYNQVKESNAVNRDYSDLRKQIERTILKAEENNAKVRYFIGQPKDKASQILKEFQDSGKIEVYDIKTLDRMSL